MRDFPIKAARTALIAGASLLAAACGGDGGEAANDAANLADSNAMLVEPANDASAMEAAVNATEPTPPANDSSDANQSGDVLGETSGGDTGGNTVERNVSGM